MNIPKKDLQKWIAALYSGKYKQTHNGTMNDAAGYCCLAVACKETTPKNKIIFNSSGFIKGGLPDSKDQPYAKKWLQNIANDFKKRTGEWLPIMNDTKYFTFEEIGMLLELVYIYKILE